MKDVSVVNWWIISRTGTKAELIRLYSPNAVAGFERCLGSLFCVERTRTRFETLNEAYRADRWLSTGKPFMHASPFYLLL